MRPCQLFEIIVPFITIGRTLVADVEIRGNKKKTKKKQDDDPIWFGNQISSRYIFLKVEQGAEKAEETEKIKAFVFLEVNPLSYRVLGTLKEIKTGIERFSNPNNPRFSVWQ